MFLRFFYIFIFVLIPLSCFYGMPAGSYGSVVRGVAEEVVGKLVTRMVEEAGKFHSILSWWEKEGK